MSQTCTYFAIIDDVSNRHHPCGVLRTTGSRCERFGRNLDWVATDLDLSLDLVEIPEAEAEAYVRQERRAAASQR